MLDAAIALALAAPPQRYARTLELCRPRLERKTGEIQTIDVGSVVRSRSGITIKGELIAYLRMGPAPPGYARAHHVGRANFDYICRVRSGKVRFVSVKPAQ